MRLSLRFLIPLLIALALFAYAAVPLVDSLMTRWFVRDLDVRSNLIATAAQEPLEELIQTGSPARILGFFHRLTNDERLYAVGLCIDDSAPPIATGAFPGELRCSTLEPYVTPGEHVLRTARGVVHVAVRPLPGAEADGARLVLVHDMSFIERRSEETRHYLFYFFAALAAECRAHHRRHRAAVVARLGRGPARAAARRRHPAAVGQRYRAGIAAHRARRAGAVTRTRAPVPAHRRKPAALDPGHAARGAARRDARQRLIIVSNREPYIHVKDAAAACACSGRPAASSRRSNR